MKSKSEELTQDKYINFPNAPILEAVLDIFVKLPDSITIDNLEAFYEPVKANFPIKLPRVSQALNFNISPQSIDLTQSLGKTDWYLFRSTDYSKIVQSRIDGFSFNKLKPYENWSTFKAQAKELWDRYFEIVKPYEITRIALRYINRIEIPLPIDDLDEYILTNPKLADKLPQALESFFYAAGHSNAYHTG